MDISSGTYRIQFNENFNFQHLEQVIDYLYNLGIDTIYASPILRAVPGSLHGYDSTDVNCINPELGTLDQLEKLKTHLAQLKIKWLQDIVPNHMAYHHENSWLMHTLEYGEISRYSSYFDTTYSGALFKKSKLMVPLLDKELNEAILAGEITIASESHGLYICYFSHRLPVNPALYGDIFGDLLSLVDPDFNDTVHYLYTNPDYSHSQEWCRRREEIFALMHSLPHRERFEQRLSQVNNDKEKVREILSKQHYRLCHWRETDQRINYRRFFTVNGLICMNVHNDDVFKDMHRFIGELLSKQIVEGLRIDHIDGLHNPSKYTRDLRSLCGPNTYIVVEKILEKGEELPGDWPVQGTTGYDFLALCNNVLTNCKSEELLSNLYKKQVGDGVSIVEQQIAKKRYILSEHMQGELENLCELFVNLDLSNNDSTLDMEGLREVIREFLVYFPIYRVYEETFPFGPDAYTTIMNVFDTMRQKGVRRADMLQHVIERAQRESDQSYRKKAMAFFHRCMQFTGPVMAKGVEDTLMYTYNRFIVHNEVGDHPENFGIPIPTFHEAMLRRQANWPSSLNTTATHDTKRGEDARARLQVLSAWPEAWEEQVNAWHKIVTAQYKADCPHPNDVYFIYQAMFGSYPMPNSPDDDFVNRFLNYLTKYLREGKERSDWATPNKTYEQRIHHFAQFLLDKNGSFFPVFHAYLKRMVDFGIMNSLVQVLLKYTCPGVPDTYQGTELWDLSFVDPDNRREVDYITRNSYLREIDEVDTDKILSVLWEDRYTGKIKLWLLKTLLALRKQYSLLFTEGEYVPLEVTGKYRQHILAYARKHQKDWLVVIVPLHLAAIDKLRNDTGYHLDWEDTSVVLSSQIPVHWRHILCPIRGQSTTLKLSTVFRDIPLAVVCYSEQPNPRSAGVLLHITSLPSRLGIGDLGPAAYDFVQFLKSSGQRWWQILPLGPTSTQQNHSPYSTWSAMAGNPLLISLETLADDGLLTREEVEKATIDKCAEVDFASVESIKKKLLHIAFERADLAKDSSFICFCEEEAYWLDDYALFVVLQSAYSQAPWYLWPEIYKSRNPEALANFEAQHQTQLREVKWTQYVFFSQWKKLKKYCQELGVRILGDVPMYVSHDAADVWAHPHLFSLKSDGSLKSVAGVPPDYFNADGQLWGMPLYDWEALKQDGYKWWMLRLLHNCKLFDKIRLDHFRAFSAYWEVSAGNKTAKNGQWKPGPGKEFFTKVKSELGKLPFIVEDLGDIDNAVYELRDAFRLPGTKVIQFAFGDDMASSPHIPHHYDRNFFAYTGTHDNNTIVGWFNEELDDAAKERISMYTSITTDKTNIADIMLKMVYASVADTAIVPMQDLVSLPGTHRMNNPARAIGNWNWMAPQDAFHDRVKTKLRGLMKLYDRI